jgi:nickel-dependent lactate racemase
MVLPFYYGVDLTWLQANNSYYSQTNYRFNVMKVELAYGSGFLAVDLPFKNIEIISPAYTPAINNEKDSFFKALSHPIGALPLLEWIRPGDKICIVFSDITRPTPNHKLIPWLLEYLSDVSRTRITLVNATGTHRPATRSELEALLTPAVLRDYTVINHDCRDKNSLRVIGKTGKNLTVSVNESFISAEVKIISGFIEPHFFAGFSGGPKGIMPGVSGLETILHNHRAENIASPYATFGITEGNPLWEEIRDAAVMAGPAFLINVTLNNKKELTGFYCGHLIDAHKAGCAHVKQASMVQVHEAFDVVITSNNGFPLDLNLYQGVKGMAAAARIVKPGGLIILACECRDGVPSGSPYEYLLQSVASPDELLRKVLSESSVYPEQWQAQIQAQIQKKAKVMVYSSLPDAVLEKMKLIPCHDIAVAVEEHLRHIGSDARIAVLPFGPVTVPYLGE